MSLVRASLLNAVAVGTKVACSIVLNKVLAVYVGPAGYAAIGQFQNAVSIVVNVAGGLLAPGVIKTTAEHFDDTARQHAVWRTAVRFSLGASLSMAVCLLLLGPRLAQWLLQRTDLSSVFTWLALTLPAMAFNNLLLAIVNGKKEMGLYVAVNIVGNLVSLLLTGLLAYALGLYGALVAFTINPAIVLLSSAAILARRDWFRVGHLWGRMSRPALRELAGFGVMGLTSALIVPATFIVIREHVTARLGMTATGYWQASWKISEVYLMLVTSTLSVYYLPRLAEIRHAQELKSEITKVYRFVLPVIVVAAAAIFAARDLIIQLLFTPEFLPMRELFAWQLTGDVIKIGSWVLGYIMLGRAMVRFFVLTEIAFAASFIALSWIFVEMLGIVGVAMAYALNYSLHWIGMWYLVKREIRQMEAEHG